MDILFNKIRKLEETPNVKIISKVEFIKKALLTGLAVFITGAAVSIGTVVWKLIVNLDLIIEAIERLK